jgi:hypothetical protein
MVAQELEKAHKELRLLPARLENEFGPIISDYLRFASIPKD